VGLEAAVGVPVGAIRSGLGQQEEAGDDDEDVLGFAALGHPSAAEVLAVPQAATICARYCCPSVRVRLDLVRSGVGGTHQLRPSVRSRRREGTWWRTRPGAGDLRCRRGMGAGRCLLTCRARAQPVSCFRPPDLHRRRGGEGRPAGVARPRRAGHRPARPELLRDLQTRWASWTAYSRRNRISADF
jgi:hypothetical protein